MEIDWDTVNDSHDVLTVPEGIYDVRVVDVREGSTRDGSPRWSMRMEVIGGPFAGKHAGWDALIWSERGKPRVKRVLSTLGLPVEGQRELQPRDVEGCRGRAQVVIEEYEDAHGVLHRRLTVPYDGWAPYEGEEGEGVDETSATREALARDSPF